MVFLGFFSTCDVVFFARGGGLGTEGALSFTNGEEILKDLLCDEALKCEGALTRVVALVSTFAAAAAVTGFFFRKDGSFLIWMLESGQFCKKVMFVYWFGSKNIWQKMFKKFG